MGVLHNNGVCIGATALCKNYIHKKIVDVPVQKLACLNGHDFGSGDAISLKLWFSKSIIFQVDEIP